MAHIGLGLRYVIEASLQGLCNRQPSSHFYIDLTSQNIKAL